MTAAPTSSAAVRPIVPQRISGRVNGSSRFSANKLANKESDHMRVSLWQGGSLSHSLPRPLGHSPEPLIHSFCPIVISCPNYRPTRVNKNQTGLYVDENAVCRVLIYSSNAAR